MPTPRPGFDLEWPPVRPAVLAYCASKLRDHHLAEDVTERVAIQASRGYDKFRGEATFLNWVLSIAWHEVAHACDSRKRRSAWVTPLEPGQLDSIPDESCPLPMDNIPNLPSPEQLIKMAEALVDLAQKEAEVVRLRLLETQLTWEQIGVQLGKNTEATKKCHGRALRKLRVALFLHLRASLAGAEIIAEAFGKARINSAGPMVMAAAEIEVFTAVVVRQDKGHHMAGVKEALVSACEKVSSCLPHGVDGVLMGVIAHGDEENELF